jgi:hypothetical protein
MSTLGVISQLSLSLLIIAVIIGYLNLNKITFHEKVLESQQHELHLNSTTHVLTKDGRLTDIGWSRSREHFLFTPNRINPSTSVFRLFNKLRYKKWEAFVFIHPDFIIGTAIFDLSYFGGYLVHYSTLEKGKPIHFHQYLNPFNKPNIEDDCTKHCLAGNYSTTGMNYNQMKPSDTGVQFLLINYTHGNNDIYIDVKINGKGFDNFVSLNPISDDSTLFYYNTKINTLTAKGTIKVNGKDYNASDLLITHDSGRGVWPMRSGWLWITANGLTKDNRNFGINIGHGFNHPNASTFTEDCFFVNGKIFKLNAAKTVQTEIEDGFSSYNIKSEFSEDNRNACTIDFKPIKKHEEVLNLIVLKDSFLIQYGTFSGSCVDDKGVLYHFEDINGIVEKKLSFW